MFKYNPMQVCSTRSLAAAKHADNKDSPWVKNEFMHFSGGLPKTHSWNKYIFTAVLFTDSPIFWCDEDYLRGWIMGLRW